VEVKFKTKAGSEINYSYTPLGEIYENIYPLLGKHGLSIRHEIVKEGSQDCIVAVLTHETYKTVDVKIENTQINHQSQTETIDKSTIQRVENELRSGPVKIFQTSEMKDTGAAITYARRYSMTMLLGISSEDDTDAKFFMESAKAAIDFAYTKAESGIDGAKTPAELDKAINVLKKDLKQVEDGKPGALGLSKEQYESLIKKAEDKKVTIGKGENKSA